MMARSRVSLFRNHGIQRQGDDLRNYHWTGFAATTYTGPSSIGATRPPAARTWFATDLDRNRREQVVRFSMRTAVPLTAIIALAFGSCAAQTAIDKSPEPDSIGVFFYLDSSTQTLKRLPQEDFKRHSGGFG